MRHPVHPFAVLLFATCLVAGLPRLATAQAVGTAFTYQGELGDAGAPASGTYDFEFQLFRAASGADAIGPTNVFSGANGNPVTVSGGVFTVRLDFGDAFAGQQRFLQIRVKRPGDAAFTVLAPRQELSPAPHALNAEFVTDGRVDSGSIADGSVGAVDIDSSLVQRRVVASCPGNGAIRAINADGTVACSTPPLPVFASGNAGTIAAALSSIGPAATVTIAAGQQIHVTAQAALGSNLAGGGSGLSLGICQRQGGGPLGVLGSLMLGLSVPQNQRHTYGATAVATGLPAGTYQVGLCGSAPTSAASWNSNEWAYVTAIVL